MLMHLLSLAGRNGTIHCAAPGPAVIAAKIRNSSRQGGQKDAAGAFAHPPRGELAMAGFPPLPHTHTHVCVLASLEERREGAGPGAGPAAADGVSLIRRRL